MLYSGVISPCCLSTNNFFDVIFSNGVSKIHPDTFSTLNPVGEFVKPGGTFYLWL